MRILQTGIPGVGHAGTGIVAAVLLAFLLPLTGGCGAGRSTKQSYWNSRGYTRVETGPLKPLGGNYLTAVKTYSTPPDVLQVNAGPRSRSVLRLYHRPAGSGEAVEVPFPEDFSVDPAVSGLFVSPDGDRIMCPGTAVETLPRPSLLVFVAGGRTGPVFEAQINAGTDGKQVKMSFHPHAAVPLWTRDGTRFALEAATYTETGDATWATFFWRFEAGGKIKTFNSFLALGPGSRHFAGWSPDGTRAAMFEGFPQEVYLTGPAKITHTVPADGFGSRPREVGVRLWLLDLARGGIAGSWRRTGGWLKEGPWRTPTGTEFVRFAWQGADLVPEEGAAASPADLKPPMPTLPPPRRTTVIE